MLQTLKYMWWFCNKLWYHLVSYIFVNYDMLMCHAHYHAVLNEYWFTRAMFGHRWSCDLWRSFCSSLNRRFFEAIHYRKVMYKCYCNKWVVNVLVFEHYTNLFYLGGRCGKEIPSFRYCWYSCPTFIQLAMWHYLFEASLCSKKNI